MRDGISSEMMNVQKFDPKHLNLKKLACRVLYI